MITVVHRQNTIIDLDMVAVLHEGKLVEFGPPQELLDSRSKFRDLHNQYALGTCKVEVACMLPLIY